MKEDSYISDIFSGLGLAISEEINDEIVIKYPIIFDKKNMQYKLSSELKYSLQPIGSFLADFLNTDFNEYNDFLEFFSKYSLSLLNYNKLLKIFKSGNCSEEKFNTFILDLMAKNKNYYLKMQEQTDMILDYCYLNSSNMAINFKPIERLYVLKRFSPNMNLLNENKSNYYSMDIWSSNPGKTEKQIYEFLSKRKNEVIEINLIIPNDISSILYKSISTILKGNTYLKVCKNCNKYFIAKNKTSSYCTNVAPGERKKTCREIGRKIVFENNKNSDSIISSYYQIYNRKAMMKSRYPDIKKYVDDYEKFKEAGKKKLSKYKNKQITSDEFKKWIKKNS